MKKQLIITFTAAASLLSLAVKADDNSNNWSGLYGGVNLGHASGTSHAEKLTGGEGAFSHISGGLGGAQIGYNFQADHIVYGVEADIQKSDITGINLFNVDLRSSQKIDWFGTARGRLGYSLGNFLLYVTGGLAIADVKANTTGVSQSYDFNSNNRQTQYGWTAGTGLEWAVDKNWILDAQYLRISLNKEDFHFISTSPSTISSTNQSNSYFNVFKIGINYKF